MLNILNPPTPSTPRPAKPNPHIWPARRTLQAANKPVTQDEIDHWLDEQREALLAQVRDRQLEQVARVRLWGYGGLAVLLLATFVAWLLWGQA